MHLDVLFQRLEEGAEADALIWRDRVYSYGWLLEHIQGWPERLEAAGIAPGTVVALEADFSPNAVALLLALIERGCVLVPLTSSVAAKREEFLEVAQVEYIGTIDANDEVAFSRLDKQADHAFYTELRRRGHPGLVLFSSGSTGKSKASVHDMVDLLEKFRTPRPAYRTVSFLLYDHIGGVNTMLHTLSNQGCLITVRDRRPESVLEAVERHHVELLPTSPTFLNMILLSEAYKNFDLSSLRLVTYGTEPMLESTLLGFRRRFPGIRLSQTYGLSETGILRAKSKSSDSLWVKLGGEGFETRIVDGILHIRARSAMLGYLNADSPFTEDGWFVTGDLVQQDGEYLRILGRNSEIINVGGEKVYPAEVESVVQELDDVAEVSIYGERNAILGNAVCARVTPCVGTNRESLPILVKKHCRERLERFKVPVKVEVVERSQHGGRFKKIRPIEGRP
ncbi:MAG: AMP-dependent synthetase [Planctomycetes bacterium]|jgi:acyl-CoA synthetase (AMP-forming)/AMP-acid ligase II|nr:AMP-dependent synthetase [Planctomycetota bacterium]